ncbi:MAG: NUDIX hydrolase [Candidatus Aenigmarchaeota archaeon]|nr:NUDIX hydrolase [Candidatus Aenigmarchaeota archaeon]
MGIIVGGVVEKDEKFLLVNAKVGTPKGLWNLPAGHVDEGETLEEAAKREAQEETGLDVEVEGLVGVYHKINPALEKNKELIRVNYKMKIKGGKISPPEDEIEKVHWFSLEELLKLRDKEVAWGTKETIIDFSKRGCVKQSLFSERVNRI